MSTTIPALPQPLSVPPVLVHAKQRRLSVAEYHRMGELGLFKPDERLELIHGLLVEKPVVTPPHAFAVTKLLKVLEKVVSSRLVVRIQMPVTLSDSEPEPDVCVARLTESEYFDRHPQPADIHLIVEVAVSSLAFDQGEKLGLYAANGVEAYWIVNLVDKRLEVYTGPQRGNPPSFLKVQHFAQGATVPITLGGVELGSVAVSDVIK
jgi:Uma2 family endonuclease